MKIRNGFVSNSSSSSFICQVCGQDASGYDMSLDEAGMYTCTKGHTFCQSHALEFKFDKNFAIGITESKVEGMKDSIKKYGEKDYYIERLKELETLLEELKNSNEEEYDYDEVIDNSEYIYEFPSQYCPICQMEHILATDMVSYLVKEKGKTVEEIENEMKEKFGTLAKLNEYLK